MAMMLVDELMILPPIEVVSGRIVGNPEVICPGSGLVMGSRLLSSDWLVTADLVRLPTSGLLARNNFLLVRGRPQSEAPPEAAPH